MSIDLINMREGERARQHSLVLFEDVKERAHGHSTTHFLEVYCPHLVWNMEYDLIFF